MQLRSCIPNCKIYYRRGLDLKKILDQMKARGYTDLVVINEDQKKPSILPLRIRRAIWIKQLNSAELERCGA